VAAFLWGQKAKSQKLDRSKIPFDTVASSGPPSEQQEHARARQNQLQRDARAKARCPGFHVARARVRGACSRNGEQLS